MARPTDIRDLQDTWNRLGEEDPMWAVASNKERWDREEFFSTGTAEIAEAISYIDSLGLNAPRRRALDFGCGLGRLTRALSGHFEEVVGVDIAPSMVASATKLNSDIDNVSFVVNERPELDALEAGAFDLVYSNITLQHMRPELAAGYIQGFVRVVSERGLILFQIPSGLRPGETGLRARLRRARRQGLRQSWRALTRRVSQPTMEMHYIPRERVTALLEEAGARVVDVRADGNAGSLYESCSYAAVREAAVSS
jgi:SAM-dependent methyltransferase